MSDPAFTLKIKPFTSFHDCRQIVIRAFDDMTPQWDFAGRIRLTVEVRHGGKVIFPKGQLYCALHGSSDGIEAKELVCLLVGMHPSAGGGEEADYYSDYTPEQLEWVEAYGEHIDRVRSDRYCDPETGSCRHV